MWANDSRRRGGAGRYEHRVIGTSLTRDGATVVIPANPDRVSLILAIQPAAAAAVSDGVSVGPLVGGAIAPVATLTAGSPCAVLSFCGLGDAIWRDMVALNIGAAGAVLSAIEVVWHPEA